MSEAPDRRLNRVAIIDIGSNSVRLVVYDSAGAALLQRFNEKVMAGLGRGLGETGRLSSEGVDAALAALRRFRAILDGLGVRRTRAVATAAVRAAEDGGEFAHQASLVLGAPIEVLSGDDEARLSSVGVRGGFFNAEGLVGDLGGSSLELARISKAGMGRMETHMLGPLAVLDHNRFDERALRKRVRAALKTSSVLEGGERRFYAVGGAWRALAKIHMDLTGYKLQILHAYSMRPKAVRAAVKAALSDDPAMRARRNALAGRRSDSLPYAALLLDEVCEAGRVNEVVISSYGLREGAALDLLGVQAADPLPPGVGLAARIGPRQVRFGQALYQFVAPVIEFGGDLFGEPAVGERLAATACLLADSGARLHPDHRAALAYELALRGGYAGADHRERAFIALAVGARYSKRFTPPDQYADLLEPEAERVARQLAACIRIGAVMSGRSADVLNDAALTRDRRTLVLSVSPRDEAMLSDTVTRRLAQAAQLLELEPSIVVYDPKQTDVRP